MKKLGVAVNLISCVDPAFANRSCAFALPSLSSLPIACPVPKCCLVF